MLCISDVHHAQDSSDTDLLIRDLQKPLKNRLIIAVGDELDSIARGDKRHKLEDLKEKFTTRKVYPRLVDAEIEDYAEIVGKYTKPEEWLGHVSGNHPLVMTEHMTDPTQRLCDMLKHVYLGYSAFVPVQIITPGNRKVGLMVMVHHGFGGTNARKEGGSLNAYIDHAMRYEGWDLALYGHRHDRWVKTIPRIRPQSQGGHVSGIPWVRSVDRKVAQCGTYLKTLSHSVYPGYAERMGYPPRPLGALILKIGVDRLRENGKDNIVLRFLGSNE